MRSAEDRRAGARALGTWDLATWATRFADCCKSPIFSCTKTICNKIRTSLWLTASMERTRSILGAPVTLRCERSIQSLNHSAFSTFWELNYVLCDPSIDYHYEHSHYRIHIDKKAYIHQLLSSAYPIPPFPSHPSFHT